MSAPRAEFDGYAEEYATHVNEALPAGFGEVDRYARIKAVHLAHLITRTFPGRSDVRILDNGCGVGMTDFYLRESFPRITGCDMSVESLEIARRRNPGLEYVVYAGDCLPFDDCSFDVAFAICVVHHVVPGQWTAFFREMLRVLVPGGLLIICEHNPNNPLTRLVVSKVEFDRDAVLLRAGKCAALAEEAGACDPRVQFITFLPLESPVWLAFERATLSWLPIGAQYQFSARKRGGPQLRVGLR
jgi:SAM-dependent methyltransferase